MGFGKQVLIKVPPTKLACYGIRNIRIHDDAFDFTNTPMIFNVSALRFPSEPGMFSLMFIDGILIHFKIRT